MNRVVHFEMHSPDAERALDFYATTFGWKVTKWDGPMEYWLLQAGDGEACGSHGGIDGGLLRSMDGQPRTVNTIAVESLDQMLEQVTAHGGQVAHPKMAVPGVGYLAYCTDPTGGLFGMLQPDPTAA